MANFMIRFFICNLFISGIIVIFFLVKQIFKNSLSSRMQYNLWFLLLGLLAVPLIPFRLIKFPQILLWINHLKNPSTTNMQNFIGKVIDKNSARDTNWINDFTLSVNNKTLSIIGYLLFFLWIIGIFIMMILTIKSFFHLYTLEKSALPLQNREVSKLYHHCLKEMNIDRNIPIYSTAFLKSPIIVGLLKPRIYLPIHLISDYKESEMRYILLHELQHYKHKDAIANYLINLTRIIYWFHPLVLYALKEMRNDREIACDTSVLEMLQEDDYEEYGNTLINFAEKISLTSFPFTSLGGNIKQIKRRIIHIASYEKPTFLKKLKGITAFLLATVLFLGFTPFLSTYAANENHYQWKTKSKNIFYIDLSTYFGKYKGSFVLYDLENDTWNIYNRNQATLRTAPDSTYKIYNALFGLEENIITPKNSFLTWNGKNYPFEAWNQDQTLQSAMNASVNWYFESIDEQLGIASINKYIKKIEYGNRNINSDFSTYWLESSLKISPIEQVELLVKLQNNSFHFAPENINTIKDSICLSTSNIGTLYGKTGTGCVNGKNINGWFLGFIEAIDKTYFFATNIKSDNDATGSNATKITMSILSDRNIWVQ